MQDLDEQFMAEALDLARQAARNGEVPVGAVVVVDGRIVGRGANAPISRHDPCAHAEILALQDAARQVANYRLSGASMYVTLEPCLMCAGAILHARVGRLVFATRDPKTGVAGSVLDVFAVNQLNHHTEVEQGPRADEAAQLLREFFHERRQRKKQADASPGESRPAGSDRPG